MHPSSFYPNCLCSNFSLTATNISPHSQYSLLSFAIFSLSQCLIDILIDILQKFGIFALSHLRKIKVDVIFEKQEVLCDLMRIDSFGAGCQVGYVNFMALLMKLTQSCSHGDDIIVGMRCKHQDLLYLVSLLGIADQFLLVAIQRAIPQWPPCDLRDYLSIAI